MKKNPCNVVTSWPLKSGIGSGVAVVAEAVHRLLKEEGYEAELISPDFRSEGYFASSLKRVMFNRSINAEIALSGRRCVAFDIDGFSFPHQVRFASINGGTLRDIVRFETGVVRRVLETLALLEKKACERAEVVFAPSLYAREKICSMYGIDPEKVKLMHNGIFFDEFRSSIERAAIKKERPPTVVSVARLYKRKGIDALIDIWPEVLSRFPTAMLRIAGGGLEYEALQKLIKEKHLADSVILEGEVQDKEKLASLYANCDVFCLPSLHETFGIVYLEAMAAEKPVVALNCTAVPEVVRDGTDGFLVEPGDMKSLTERIILLLGDRDLSMKMGLAGMERVKRNFDWRDVVKPLTGWLES